MIGDSAPTLADPRILLLQLDLPLGESVGPPEGGSGQGQSLCRILMIDATETGSFDDFLSFFYGLSLKMCLFYECSLLHCLWGRHTAE